MYNLAVEIRDRRVLLQEVFWHGTNVYESL